MMHSLLFLLLSLSHISTHYTTNAQSATAFQERTNEVKLVEQHHSAASSSSSCINLLSNLSFAIHRNGEATACESISFHQKEETLTKALKALGADDCKDLDKYRLETWLTQLLIDLQQQQNACNDMNNLTAPAGLTGYCDYGPQRTVIQNDVDKLVRVPSTGSLPCRFYSREGKRMTSVQDLLALKKSNRDEQCISMEGESCGGSSDDDDALHLYAVPAGRVFMFASSYIGERFVVDHVNDTIGEMIVVETISLDPRVFEIYNFFSKEEAQQLIDKALNETSETHKLHRSTTGATGGSIYKKRTSENAWDTNGEQAKRIKRRCLEFLGFDEYWESHTDGLQILRYQNNQAYTPHADYLTPSRDENHNYKTNGVGTNRFATILLYMSDLGENDGGETVFTEAWPLGTPEEEKLSKPELIRKLRESGVTEGKLEPGSWEEEMYAECRAKLAIRPRQGRAVLFYSQFPNGIEDTNARHGACPVLNGTKWAANLWVWSGPRPEYEHAPKRWPDRPDKDIKAREPKQLYAEFRNTGSDPAFADAELYYEDTLFGKLDAEGPPIAVNTFEGHKWNVRVNGETLQQFVISKKERQVFQV